MAAKGERRIFHLVFLLTEKIPDGRRRHQTRGPWYLPQTTLLFVSLVVTSCSIGNLPLPKRRTRFPGVDDGPPPNSARHDWAKSKSARPQPCLPDPTKPRIQHTGVSRSRHVSTSGTHPNPGKFSWFDPFIIQGWRCTRRRRHVLPISEHFCKALPALK